MKAALMGPPTPAWRPHRDVGGNDSVCATEPVYATGRERACTGSEIYLAETPLDTAGGCTSVRACLRGSAADADIGRTRLPRARTAPRSRAWTAPPRPHRRR